MLYFTLLSMVLFLLISLLDSMHLKITNVISIFFIVPLLMFNFANPDYLNYEGYFQHYDGTAGIEKGFVFLSDILKYVGIYEYQAIPICLGILIIYTFFRISRYVKNGNFIVFLYFIFPFMIDIIQIRNTFMMFFVVNAIFSYIESKKMKTIIWLILASLFHSYGYLWIIFFFLIERLSETSFKLGDKTVVANFFDMKNSAYNKIIIILSLLNLVVGNRVINLILIILPTFISTKLTFYLSGSLNIDSLYWGIILVCDLLVFSYFIKKIRLRNNEINENNLVNFLFYVLFHGLLVIGALLYVFEINRFFRLLFLLKYILYGVLSKYLNRRELLLLSVYLFIMSGVMMIIFYTRGIDYDSLIIFNKLWNRIS